MAGADLGSGEPVRFGGGWSTGYQSHGSRPHGTRTLPPNFDLADPDELEPPWSRPAPRRRPWRLPRVELHWPRPLGGTGALLVATVVLIAAVVVVAIGSGRVGTRAPRSAGPPAAAPGPAVPTWYLGGPDNSGPPSFGADPLSSGPVLPTGGYPSAADPGAGYSSKPVHVPPPVRTSGSGPASRPGPAVEMVTGVGCPATASASYYASYPAGAPVATLVGGWAGAGCAGLFWSVPMSGSATTDDPDTFVLWYFSTGALSRGTCGISIYVPQAASQHDAAGNPTVYKVIRSRDDPREIGSFSIDQTANHGRWVDGGSFAFDGGHIAVKMVNRGPGADGDRHAAAQLMLRCRA